MATPIKTRAESRRALVVSIALHVVIGAGLIRMFLMPGAVRSWLHLDRKTLAPVEHLRYVAIAPTTTASAVPSKAPVVNAPPPAPAAAPAAAPLVVPRQLPVAPVDKTPAPEPDITGTGPVASTGGPGQGARPEYHGPRVWVPALPPQQSARPLSPAERTDSAVRAIVEHHNDSLAMLGPHRQPGDWTIDHNGKKYGIDKQYIHLGPIEIPTAVLAALPLNNFTGNPIASMNERLLTSRHDDIAFQANRALNEEEMNKAIKQERERKEREHEQQQKKGGQQDPQTGSPTVAKNGNQ
jgi:hypothetical protein